MKKIKISLLFLTLILIVSACKKDDDINNPINSWILSELRENYYWNNTISSSESAPADHDSEGYFYSITGRNGKDKWSYITDDFEGMMAEIQGEPLSMGYELVADFRFSGSSELGIYITHVFQNTPASEAGLKRGDVIVKINDYALTRSNVENLFYQNSYKATLSDGRSVELTARTIETDPMVYRTVFNEGGKTIGYMVYMSFTSGKEDKFLASLDNAAKYFNQNNIDNLIVDFRYNGGGDINSALHLASLIAPKSAIEQNKVLIKYNLNSNLQALYPASELVDTLKNISNNLDLEHVHFIITKSSASASELLVSGLKPYMKVTTIGAPSHGKYAGMHPIQHPISSWGMLPITFTYTNANGEDVEGGIPVDVGAAENALTGLYPFGDTRDPMLSAAIRNIAGTLAKIKVYEKDVDLPSAGINLAKTRVPGWYKLD